MTIQSFGGNSINDGVTFGALWMNGRPRLPPVGANLLGRVGAWPLIGGITRPGVRFSVLIYLVSSHNVSADLATLAGYLSPEDETPKAFVVDGRYVMAVCESLQPYKDKWHQQVATFRIDGDVRWRDQAEDSESWAVTASGQTNDFDNTGEDDAYPRITITPTGVKASSYAYKVFVPIRWRISAAYSNYPTDIADNAFDTDALVTAAKMQADGDDLRVWNNGVEIDRWLQDIDTVTTQVWCNLTFQAKWDGTLSDAMLIGDTVTTLDVEEDISGAPSTGILICESEAFTYTSKNNGLKRFLGVTRAAKGTSAAGHAASTAIWWCQHDLWILYGNAAATAPVVDSAYKPIIELDSTNTSWVYEEFGADVESTRTGQWYFVQSGGTGVLHYKGNQGTSASDPWIELGLAATDAKSVASYGRLVVYNPCGITIATYSNGECYSTNSTVHIWKTQCSADGSVWTTIATLPDPSGGSSVWSGWSSGLGLTAGSLYACLYSELPAYEAEDYYVEVADCTLTLDSTYTPTITMGSEQGNYLLDVVLANTTTGDSIQITYTMALNDAIEVDTDLKTLTDKQDETSQFQALTLTGGARKDWLKLQPGVNTISFTDVGTSGVTVLFEWEDRSY
jgi:hypothetical protein